LDLQRQSVDSEVEDEENLYDCDSDSRTHVEPYDSDAESVTIYEEVPVPKLRFMAIRVCLLFPPTNRASDSCT